MLKSEIQEELESIDSQYNNKVVAREAMEKFLASIGYDKETRIGLILDFVIGLTEPKEDDTLTQIEEVYKELASVKIGLINVFRDDTPKLKELLEGVKQELTVSKALLAVMRGMDSESTSRA